ncbi:MAG: alpha/beta hydrolase, partial [Actinobacteria bacterium]|nr:alpha/beta hydrolase [Actinomycetota bacterium]
NMPPGSTAETGEEPAASMPDLGPVLVPTMGVWSSGDFALTEQQMVESGAFVKGQWRYERVADAGHWLQLERPDEINRLLLDFLPLA